MLVFLSAALAQQADSIKIKNRELEKIRGEINSLQKELTSKTQKEKESLLALENISRQNLLLNKLIVNLKIEEAKKEQEIEIIETHIDSVGQVVSSLKDQYARYVVWTYKHGKFSYLSFLFNAASFHQALVRYKYIKYITEQNKKALDDLNRNKIFLSQLKSRLQAEAAEKLELVSLKEQEQGALKEKRSQRQQLIAALKKDQDVISDEIASKRQAEISIKNLIARLVEAERERKEKLRESRLAGNKVVDYNYDKFENFAGLQGKLAWPIKEGTISRSFGENKNEKLKTVTLNYGIDIKVKGETEVHAVAEGVISAIDWIPGYGSIVIVTHKDEFRTVYGHITDITVIEGQKINSGAVIGKVNDSLEGNILHFEIWRERNYQNPQNWLARK